MVCLCFRGLYVTTVTDIEVIVHSEMGIIGKCRLEWEGGGFSSRGGGQVRDWNMADRGVNN